MFSEVKRLKSISFLDKVKWVSMQLKTHQKYLATFLVHFICLTFPDLFGSNEPVKYLIFVNKSIWIEIPHVKMLIEACGFSKTRLVINGNEIRSVIYKLFSNLKNFLDMLLPALWSLPEFESSTEVVISFLKFSWKKQNYILLKTVLQNVLQNSKFWNWQKYKSDSTIKVAHRWEFITVKFKIPILIGARDKNIAVMLESVEQSDVFIRWRIGTRRLIWNDKKCAFQNSFLMHIFPP